MGLHVGLIGTGEWGRVHLAALNDCPLVARVTLCARDASHAATLAGGSPKVAGIVSLPEQLCDDPSLDVIDVVLPHDLHVPTAMLALTAGKHVVCEKPAATSMADFDRVAAAAIAAGRQLMVVMNQLYNPRVERLGELVADGLVGRPFLLVENAYSNHSRSYCDPNDWRTRRSRAGGGVLIDGGYHMIYKQLDLLKAYGRPRWVSAEAAQLNLHPNGEPVAELGEDFVAYTIGFDGGLRVSGSHAWTLESTPNRPRQSLLAGTRGTLEMPEGIEKEVVLHSDGSSRKVELPPCLADPRGDTLRLCLLDLLTAIAEERPPRRASLSAARRTLSVILAAYESSRCGARVEVS